MLDSTHRARFRDAKCTRMVDAADLVDLVVLQGACEDRGRGRLPDFLSEYEIARLQFRFAVGDVVACSITSDESGESSFQEGTIVQRAYREDEWPAGCYAAVRGQDLIGPLSLPSSHVALFDVCARTPLFPSTTYALHACCLLALCSIKCGYVTTASKALRSSTPHATMTPTFDSPALSPSRRSRALVA